MTLHKLSNNLDFDGVLNDAFKVDEELFDVVLVLKPFQIPSESQSEKFQGDLSSFPVVDYRPLDRFWTELVESFGEEAQFYCNDACKIGVKFNTDVQAAKTILEDIQVSRTHFGKSL